MCVFVCVCGHVYSEMCVGVCWCVLVCSVVLLSVWSLCFPAVCGLLFPMNTNVPQTPEINPPPLLSLLQLSLPPSSVILSPSFSLSLHPYLALPQFSFTSPPRLPFNFPSLSCTFTPHLLLLPKRPPSLPLCHTLFPHPSLPPPLTFSPLHFYLFFSSSPHASSPCLSCLLPPPLPHLMPSVCSITSSPPHLLPTQPASPL